MLSARLSIQIAQASWSPFCVFGLPLKTGALSEFLRIVALLAIESERQPLSSNSGPNARPVQTTPRTVQQAGWRGTARQNVRKGRVSRRFILSLKVKGGVPSPVESRIIWERLRILSQTNLVWMALIFALIRATSLCQAALSEKR